MSVESNVEALKTELSILTAEYALYQNNDTRLRLEKVVNLLRPTVHVKAARFNAAHEIEKVS